MSSKFGSRSLVEGSCENRGERMPDRETTSTSAASPKLEELQDRLLVCIDCGDSFIWSAGEQAFFRDKQLTNPPKRCKGCKQAKNERLAAIELAQSKGIRQKITVKAVCAGCGEQTTVPFYPSQGRPVYCRACFQKNQKNGSQPPT
jgi:CxxC-x17-CxxC domain-containing protein